MQFPESWLREFCDPPLNTEQLAELLTTAGLLSSRKDDKGYALLNQTVHFGGTLQHLDKTQWHDLLAKAAAPKPEEKKNESTPPAAKK